MARRDLGEIAQLLLTLVPDDGTPIGNIKLRKLLSERLGSELDESIYFAAQASLVDAGVVLRGQGRGGSVMRSQTQPDALTLESQEIPSEARVAKPKQTGLTLHRRQPGEPSKPARKADDAKVIAYRHEQKRKNNPEVGSVTPETDPEQPQTRWAYDPHIDPALQFDVGRAKVEALIDDALASGDEATMRGALEALKRMAEPYLNWAGKAERTSFEVDTVSLHVHERIDPATILAAVQKRLRQGKDGAPLQQDWLRAWFEQPLAGREALEFYKHDRGWSNRLIAGDSLLVMNSLLQKEGMAGQVQMIYIDPPYGIKYGSNFQPFVNKREVSDGKDQDLTQEPEMIKAFRDTWQLGVHSYLTYLRDRLLLAKNLLRPSGSVFVQISDENLHHVREVLDEVFGPTNFIALITFSKTTGTTGDYLAGTADYLLFYGKDKSQTKYRQLFNTKEVGGDGSGMYINLQTEQGERRRMTLSERESPSVIPMTARPYRLSDITSPRVREGRTGYFEVTVRGASFLPRKGEWKTHAAGIQRLQKANRLEISGSSPAFVRFIDDFAAFPVSNLWGNVAGAADKFYVVQTAPKVTERCLLMTTDPGDLVLDPTCGSGTTAFIAEKWGRRWITCDTSRVAITLSKQRLMTASYDYYELRHPHEGLHGGFIYKTVPHVTLKSIANNPEIDELWLRMHPPIEKALGELNAALKAAAGSQFKVTEGARKGNVLDFAQGDALRDWEVPFDFPADWKQSARDAFDAFHGARQAMQRRMDESIAAHADQETLYDQPVPARDKLRITGPFTVEAVPATAELPVVRELDEDAVGQEADASIARSGESARQHQWRDELLKTGIRGKGGQMLRFAELETLPDTRHLHCTGHLDNGDRVVVSFGQEYAALEQKQVELAMREASELFPRPKMIVFCAFAFDPEAAKDIDATKGITALHVQMNTDLLTDDLKKARSSNQSFWLMGQPDVEVRRLKGGKYQVEVHGFDYFDTVKGELVSGGKGKIAAWALDTDYDERSLFPRQVFFPMAGAKDGWNKLKRDIKAELNEALLDKLHGTVSLPFEAGENHKIAVKIVDDRGIESLRVMTLEG